MSTDFGKLFTNLALLTQDDPKAIELVENITSKTLLGKIVWQKLASSLVATVRPLQLNFVRSSYVNAFGSLLGLGGAWDMFSIRTEDGKEILKVEQPQTSSLAVLAPTTTGQSGPPPRSKLLQAVDKLFSVADVKGKGDIDKALDIIKNL